MTEFWKRLRHKIAYWLASDWIYDLEYRLSGLLCEATGSRLSKSYYTLDAMVSAVHDYNEECERDIAMDAVKDFVVLLKERAYTAENEWSHGEHPLVVEVDDIDAIVAEMEEQK